MGNLINTLLDKDIPACYLIFACCGSKIEDDDNINNTCDKTPKPKHGFKVKIPKRNDN